jgi:hypothetical protein
MTLKYITGRGQPHSLDVQWFMGGCIFSKIRSINFSSNASLPRLSYSIGR